MEGHDTHHARTHTRTCPKQRCIQTLLHRISFPPHLIPFCLHPISLPLYSGVLLLQFTTHVLRLLQLLAKRVSLLLKIVVQSGSCAHTHVVFQEEGKSEREDKTMVWKCKC